MVANTEAEAIRLALEVSRLREERDRLEDVIRGAALYLKLGHAALALEQLENEI